MALQIDDVLTAICTEVNPFHANDFQKVYALGDSTEAKLAFDVLVAYGFVAKVYHTPGKPSKLYVAHPTQPAEQLENTLAAALAYATTLKQIKQNLDQLCSQSVPALQSNTYTMTFVNMQPTGKQIMIQVVPPAGAEANVQANSAGGSLDTQATEAAAPDQQAAAKTAATPPKVVKKIRKAKNPYEDDFAAGPAVGKGFYPTKIAPEGGRQEESLRKRMMLLVFGNMATSSFATLMWLVLIFVLFSLFVFAKAFICYDFVAKKKNAWYCREQGQMTQEELRKKQQIERQKQLGLQPVEEPPQ